MNIGKFYIYTSEPFPHGLAATNRIISYAKGFLRHGKEVEVVCFARTERHGKILNAASSGVYQGIRYRYLSGSPVISRSFLGRRLDNFFLYFFLLFYAFRTMDRECAVVYYSSSTSHLLLIKAVAMIRSARIYKEESEHPSVYERSKNPFSKFLFNSIHYRLFDGLFLMTRGLVDHFLGEGFSAASILHVPMTVEFDRYLVGSEEAAHAKEIVYTGMLDDKKDGTDVLLTAFSRISSEYPEYSLSLYGEASSASERERYQRMAHDLNIGDKVVFHGRVSRDVITERVVRAGILVLPRPDSVQAQHGFPTKLGEYLATGIPVVVTAVGEIPNYLRDKESVMMAVPGDVDSLVEKFREIINDYPAALNIARRGRAVADECFNNIKQTENIIAFVECGQQVNR